MWSTTHVVHDLNAHFQHPVEGLTMQKNEPFDYVTLAGATLQPHDDGLWKEAGSGSTEDADSIALLDSPFGSEHSYLPPLPLPPHSILSSLDMSFLDADLVAPTAAAGSHSQPMSCQLDSAMEDYTQTWRELVQGSSLLESSFFPLGQPQSAFSFDADPTPPLSFDFDLPAIAAEGVADTEENSSAFKIVAPKPVRVHNPAIQLAALVEDEEDAASPSQSDDIEHTCIEGNDVEDAVDSAAQEYGYSKEQLQEYMSDSESSCDEEDFAEDEEEDAAPSLETFQFTFDDSSSSIATDYRLLAPSPLSPLPPPESPLSPTAYTVPQLSRVSQLRDSMRDRRVARQGQGQGHARHYSVPDIHYRPPNWNETQYSEPTVPVAARRQRGGPTSHSVDWSALALDSIMFSPVEAYPQVEQFSPRYADMQYSYPSMEQAYR